MTSFTSKPGKKSPDRQDGLVWAVTELAIRANTTTNHPSIWSSLNGLHLFIT